MGQFSVQIPSLIGGVSQQAPQLRLVGQAESQVNCYPSLVDGLMKRHPIEHVAALDDLSSDTVYPPRDSHIHVINRDPDERYVVMIDEDGGGGTGGVTVVELDGTPVPVFGPLGAGPDFSYLDFGSEPANVNVKAVTIADYTLVLNRTVSTALSTDRTQADPSDGEGFLFVRAGNYLTTYRAFLQQEDTTYEVAVRTWDGVAPSPGVKERWTIDITSAGNTLFDWTVTIFGATATYTVQFGDSTSDVATNLATAINALSGVSASAAGSTITIIGDTEGSHFIPAVVPPSAGTYVLTNTVVGDAADELPSVDTGDIAQALMDAIVALPGSPFTATRIGAVVRVESATPLSSVRVEDGHQGTDFIKVHRTIGAIDSLPLVGVDGFTLKVDGDTADAADDYFVSFVLDSAATAEEWELTVQDAGAVGSTWTAIVGGNAATYTVLLGDTPSDVATGLAASITALANVSAAAVGQVVTVTADTAGPQLAIEVTAATGGLFLLEKTTDSVGTFGPGKWVEGRGFNIPVGVDPETMPHRLIRRQDDAAGTVTGTPFAKWFEWSPNEWDERSVGDQSTAEDPSFIGSTLDDMFFFRDRLGFSSGQKVVMSEVSRFFNLYRTTVLSLPDSDPIDITVPSTSVVRIRRAIPLERRLVLFSDDVQFILDGDPILTPQTVQVSAVSRYQADTDADPLAIADGVFFASSRGDFSGVRRLFSAGTVEDQFSSEDTTIAVPQYLPGGVLQMASIEPEGLLVCLLEDDRRALYLYKTLRSGNENLQTAWFRYDLGSDAEIQGFGTVGNTLHLVVHRHVAAYLERTVIQSDVVDDGADYLTHLDRRTSFNSGTYSNITGRTSWTLPYHITGTGADAISRYAMVVKSTTGVDGGDVYPLEIEDNSDLEETVVSAQGNHAATAVWIGKTYEMRYKFSKLYLKNDSAAGGQSIRGGGRLQMLHGSIQYERTAALTVEVTPRYRDTRTAAVFTGQSIGEALLGEFVLRPGEYRFPIKAQEADVEVVSDGPLPCALQAAQFEVDFTPRMGVYRGG